MYISVLEADGFARLESFWRGGNQALACNKNRRVTNEFEVAHHLKARMLFFSYEIAGQKAPGRE